MNRCFVFFGILSIAISPSLANGNLFEEPRSSGELAHEMQWLESVFSNPSAAARKVLVQLTHLPEVGWEADFFHELRALDTLAYLWDAKLQFVTPPGMTDARMQDYPGHPNHMQIATFLESQIDKTDRDSVRSSIIEFVRSFFQSPLQRRDLPLYLRLQQVFLQSDRKLWRQSIGDLVIRTMETPTAQVIALIPFFPRDSEYDLILSVMARPHDRDYVLKAIFGHALVAGHIDDLLRLDGGMLGLEPHCHSLLTSVQDQFTKTSLELNKSSK